MSIMRRTATLLTIVLLGACGGDAVSPSPIVGHWVLQSVNDSPLPYTFPAVPATGIPESDELGGWIDFDATGAFSRLDHIRSTMNGAPIESSLTTTGTYIREGSELSLLTQQGGSFSGTLVGGALRLTAGPTVLIYTRQ